MTLRKFLHSRIFLCGVVVLVGARVEAVAEPSAKATGAFDSYVAGVETRLARQRQSPGGFVVAAGQAQNEAALRRGELAVERLTPSSGENLPGAMLHHWRGTAFAPGARAVDFERLMKDIDAYPQHFAPEVVRAKLIATRGDRLQASMRVRQKHVITVVMDTAYDIDFGWIDARRGYSISRSTRIAEIASPGTTRERALSAGEEHGFLWRLNTYWSYEERDGGLYMQIETVSLTRSIPTGLAWVVRPFVESVPRESLQFTLEATRNALLRRSQR